MKTKSTSGKLQHGKQTNGVGSQIFNIGVESHDDLNDALVYLLQGLANQGLEFPKIHWIEM
jgi:hypothetical protein